jgi:phosphopantothenoylcysteine decarboxylase/phosphopantothenate--cysteine ligase
LGRAKAKAKGADLTVVNDVSEGRAFGRTDNAVWLVDAHGDVVGEAAGSKRDVAEAVMSAAATTLAARDELRP